MRPKKIIRMKRPLNFLRNVCGNAPKIIDPKACTEKPGDYRTRIPAGGGECRREAVIYGNLAIGGNQKPPARFPPFQGHPGGPEHGREIHSNNGAGRLNAIAFELERAIDAISIIWNLKNDGDGPGLKLKQPGRNPVHLTQIFKARNGISIIGQQGIVGGEAAF